MLHPFPFFWDLPSAKDMPSYCPFFVDLFTYAAKEKLFPVADATTFFTDLHHILRVIATGNIRTLCHHRLVLLEQVIVLPKFTFIFS